MNYKLIFNLFIITSVVIGSNRNLQAQEMAIEIEDNFKIRGFHLDLRIQVMTPKALENFAKELSDFGLNTLIVEWEATYPFKNHATISNELSYSREEIKSFIGYCNNLGIQVIPLQQSLGHVEYILRNSRYSHLKEDKKDISQLCPLKNEENKQLFTELFSDMASMHNSDYIHIGGDETYLLGHCEDCSKMVAEEGKSKLFVNHMKMIAEIIINLGKKPVMWADIILKYPEAADELPKETIFIDWNYGWKTNYFGDVGSLQEKGFKFWGAPAIRSHPDDWFLTEWKKHFNNQRDFIPYARKAAYEGIIMTSWSTSGLYGFNWDVGYNVVEMKQIRNTYPLSGFRILIAAYAQALKQKEPINPKEFVTKYAMEQFQLSVKSGEKLWKALTVAPELIENGKPAASKSIAEMRLNSEVARNILYMLKPRNNKNEFEHFRLMADLRQNYLEFKEIELKYNSDQFTEEGINGLLLALKKVLGQAIELDLRFMDLNKNFLYDFEIREQNNIRVKSMKILYNRLAKKKN